MGGEEGCGSKFSDGIKKAALRNFRNPRERGMQVETAPSRRFGYK